MPRFTFSIVTAIPLFQATIFTNLDNLNSLLTCPHASRSSDLMTISRLPLAAYLQGKERSSVSLLKPINPLIGRLLSVILIYIFMTLVLTSVTRRKPSRKAWIIWGASETLKAGGKAILSNHLTNPYILRRQNYK